MRGHIQRRGNSYRIAVSAGFDPVTGKRRQIFRTVRGTKREAERELVRLLREADQGTIADSGRLTVAEYLTDQWLPHMAQRVRPRTHLRYGQLIQQHVVPRIGSLSLRKLRPSHIQSVIDRILADGLAPRTALHAFRVLSEALRQAVRWQLLAVNPATAIQPPRPGRYQVVVPDSQVVGRILELARGTRLYVLLVVAAGTGMRRGEVLGLKWSNVDLDARLARVVVSLERAGREMHFAEPKTQRARRTVALPPFVIEDLRRHRREQAERRLLAGLAWQDLNLVADRGDGGPIDPDAFSAAFATLAEKAGCPDVRLHDLRHAYATRLLEANVHPKIVSEALGHSTVGFTLDVYSHVVPSLQEHAARAIEEALGQAARQP